MKRWSRSGSMTRSCTTSPQNAQYYAAYGAVMYGLYEAATVGVYAGMDKLKDFILNGRAARLGESAGPPLIKEMSELDEFRQHYTIPRFDAKPLAAGEVVR